MRITNSRTTDENKLTVSKTMSCLSWAILQWVSKTTHLSHVLMKRKIIDSSHTATNCSVFISSHLLHRPNKRYRCLFFLTHKYMCMCTMYNVHIRTEAHLWKILIHTSCEKNTSKLNEPKLCTNKIQFRIPNCAQSPSIIFFWLQHKPLNFYTLRLNDYLNDRISESGHIFNGSSLQRTWNLYAL